MKGKLGQGKSAVHTCVEQPPTGCVVTEQSAFTVHQFGRTIHLPHCLSIPLPSDPMKCLQGEPRASSLGLSGFGSPGTLAVVRSLPSWALLKPNCEDSLQGSRP